MKNYKEEIKKFCKDMKVCFLITGLGMGGAESHLLKLLPRLKYNKFVISILNLNDYGKEIEKREIKVYYLGLNRINIIQTIMKFRKIIKYEKPDIIDTYLIHANLFGRIFGKVFRVKRIISSMRSDYSKFKVLKFIDKFTQNLADIFILNSKSLLTYAHKKNRTPLKKIKFLPNGVELKKIYSMVDMRYDIREELGLIKESFLLISIGRLIKDKNLKILIKAMKFIETENIFLLIIGDGPERKILYKLTKKLKLDKKIFFLGKIKNIFNLINCSDLFILPSIREGMSNALLEAMTLKKVCIVSDIPQNRYLIKDGFNGFVFDPKNERMLSEKIMNVYTNKYNKELGLESFKIIQNNYNMNEITIQYEKILKNLWE